jgi:lipopolysaccharide transport system permease protein
MFMFLTPVIYPISMLGNKYKWFLSLNPMSGVIETARKVIFSNGIVNWHFLSTSALIGLFLFIFGIMYFRKTEGYFADLI